MAAEKIVYAARQTAISLLDALKTIVAGEEASPPVGSQDVYGDTLTAPETAAAGGSGLLLLLLLGWLFLRK